MEDIEWYTEIGGIYLSLAVYGVTLSKQLMEIMGNPKYVMMGYVDEGIAIKPCEQNEKALRITGLGRKDNGSARISSRRLRKYLFSRGMECGEGRGGKRYAVRYNKHLQMGHIDLMGVV